MRGIGAALALVLALVAAVALTACGGGESDEDKITSAIETAATSTDPASCEETQTQAFMEQSKAGEGKEAVEECEEDAESGAGNPDSVDVTKIEVDGEEATAEVAFHGGNYDGQTPIVGLVEEDGDWKLNEIEGFAVFDREKLLTAFGEALAEHEDQVPAEVASCIVEGLDELSEAELEEVVVNGTVEAINEFAEECVE